jgi:two-component system chemotaxis sensor kinase CheA
MGMNIVKTSVQSARGKIEIKTEKEQFTEISLVFPLSMAIIDGMIIKVQDIFFVIPINNVVENIQLDQDNLYSVENKANVINLREEIIPVVVLKDFFELPTVYNSNRKVATIVTVQDKKYAFIVDSILGKKEIVIKPLGTRFAALKGISAGTILQGGKIGYIIDIEEIVTAAANLADLQTATAK